MATPETANHKSVINQMSINASTWTGTTIVTETRYKKKNYISMTRAFANNTFILK